ncbi:sulfatase [Prosthecobacter sp.]|uniref:sulfatase n=1 Tax=Prosthecobacter sp. TaxID=1965333 RepID=UPI001D5C9A48|nr:sulfatase [Prosthecobacter sp.]MCB1275399.1 sulfatase [Prosthecobacter sp.]
MRLFLSLLFALLISAPAFAAKPNVLLIIADDLGYNDVGFQGCKEIPTPHLDKLAARSLRFTNGYVSHPFCSPTRAGTMTGRYQHRFGHENNPAWLPEDTIAGLPVTETTFPQLMKQAGYTTGAVGKWHLGAHPQFHPNRRGFDEYLGILGGGHQYFPGDKGGVEYTIPLNRNGKDEAQTKYLTEQFGDEASAFIGRHAGEQKPWMLYLAFNAPHTPLQAPQKWLDQFSQIPDKSRQIYAAMVASMDEAVGGVLAKLDETKQSENTLIFFVSDNGGPNLAAKSGSNFTDNAPLRGAKGMVYEGGMRVPFLVSWPAKIKPGIYEQPVIALDFLPTSLAAADEAGLTPKNLDGVNLLPFLSGENTSAPHDTLFWRTNGPGGNNAVRRGNWKLVRLGKAEPELYDLAADIGETKNLAAEKPEIVKELVGAIAEWEKGTIPPIFQSPKQGPKKKKK